MSKQNKIHIDHFSDLLCVWAYTSQIRIDELKKQFGDQITISYHYFPIFGCTQKRIAEGWSDRGGYAGFGQHVIAVGQTAPHIDIHPDIWRTAPPATSVSGHHFLKSVQLMEQRGVISGEPVEAYDGKTLFEETAWRLRRAFFSENRNIAEQACQMEVARKMDLPIAEIEAAMNNGEALAAICRDIQLRDEFNVTGSPTYVMNEGRQILYGNVGYKVIEANIIEVLNRPEDVASWC